MARQSSVADRPDARTTPPVPVPPRKRRSPVWAKALVGVGAVLLVASTGTYGVAKYAGNRYENKAQRADLLGDAVKPAERNAPPKVDGPLTFLVAGSDSRDGENANSHTADGVYGSVGQRSDTIMLVYIPKSMDRAYVISVPRDTYTSIADQKGTGFHGRDKINASFATGGTPSLVKTVTALTGMKIDYPVIVDFSAVRKMTDLVGGVDVVVDRTSVDSYRMMAKGTKYPTTKCWDQTHGRYAQCLTFKKGPLHLDAELAEYYVRQRMGLPGGDLDRAKRQQQFMRALMTKVSSSSMLTDIGKFDKLLTAGMQSLKVDKSMPVQALAFQLKSLRTSDLVFLTIPVDCCTTKPGSGSVVMPRTQEINAMFAALRNGTIDQWMLTNKPNDVSHGA
ncbi:MAG: putative cell envelope-related transcriptional attenuator [Actinomycetia bacterium]|nr:putative cell envelope-related transcriptional attenuator [Actinomycetes bacterium]